MRLERACRSCGCTEHNACPGGCWWVEEDLCSACAELPDADLGDETDDCPAAPLADHQVLWTSTTDGYCVRCGAAVHA